MPNLPCTSHFTAFPLRSSIYLIIGAVRLISGRKIMNEEQNFTYSKWGHKTIKAPEKPSFGLASSLRTKPSACVCAVFIWMTAGPLPMACPEGHEFNQPNPSFPRVSGLYDPCVSLLDTPCPVQPSSSLSLPTASHSHPALCVYSASSSATPA